MAICNEDQKAKAWYYKEEKIQNKLLRRRMNQFWFLLEMSLEESANFARPFAETNSQKRNACKFTVVKAINYARWGYLLTRKSKQILPFVLEGLCGDNIYPYSYLVVTDRNQKHLLLEFAFRNFMPSLRS
jgi:hypothetical protein